MTTKRNDGTASDDATFAQQLLARLLRRIADTNLDDDGPSVHYHYAVSHAWVDGPTIFVVHAAARSDKTWGLVRDTRRSLIGEGPWLDAGEGAILGYYLDFEEGWADDTPDADLGTIRWRGDIHQGLPQRKSDLLDVHRCVLPTELSEDARLEREKRRRAAPVEPRRYADPECLPPHVRDRRRRGGSPAPGA